MTRFSSTLATPTAYRTSLSAFIAPVAGVYHFDAMYRGGAYNRVSFSINGAAYGWVASYVEYQSYGGNDYNPDSISTVRQLAVNDKIQLYVHYGTIYMTEN